MIDRRDVAQQRILLQVGGEDAFGDDEQPRAPVNRRSKRMCQPISRPTVQPRSSAIRRAIARAATRLGCRSRTRPRSTSAGGTRVVLPAPGAATSTAARWRVSASTIRGRAESTGRAGNTEYHQSLPPGVFCGFTAS